MNRRPEQETRGWPGVEINLPRGRSHRKPSALSRRSSPIRPISFAGENFTSTSLDAARLTMIARPAQDNPDAMHSRWNRLKILLRTAGEFKYLPFSILAILSAISLLARVFLLLR
jgi:hypothetical protein